MVFSENHTLRKTDVTNVLKSKGGLKFGRLKERSDLQTSDKEQPFECYK